MTPKVKFIIYEQNVCPDGIQIRQPAGWKDIQLVLERHPKFYSLIEYFEGTFLWYGQAIELFHQIETESGPDATVTLVVSVSFQRDVWEDLFNGLIDLSELEELTKQTVPYKIKAPIIRNDTWAKLINRMSTPVDQLAALSLDGDPVTVENKISLPLPSQTIFDAYKIHNSVAGGNLTEWTIPNSESLVVDFIDEEYNSMEQGEIFTYPVSQWPDSVPFDLPKSVAIFDGVRRVRISVDFYQGSIIAPQALIPLSGSSGLRMAIYYKDATPIVSTTFLDRVDMSGNGKNWTRFTCDVEYNQLAGDFINIFLLNNSGVSQNVFMGMPVGAPPDFGTEQYIKIDANTTYEDTETDSILLKNSFINILRKIIGKDEVLQSTALDGYLGNYALQKILHLRGWLMVDKPFTMSFEDNWEGASPALALGLGYDEDTGLIEIETIGHFFKITPSITFNEVGDITRLYATNYLYKLIENGFKDWSAESPGGIDDVQTKKKYRLRNKISGKTLSNLSGYFAAALAMEEARRKRAEETKDYKFDEKISIIAVKDDGVGGYTPELGADFESVANVNNPNSRYNFRLAVARVFKRWQPYYQGCLEYYDNEKFYFASGEGNVKAVITFKSTDPEVKPEDSDGGIAENQDIDKGADNLILPNLYKATGVPITWDQYKIIRASKNNAIGLPYNHENRSMYINRLSYKLMKGNFDADLLETSPTAFDDYMLFQDLVPMAFQNGALMKYN